METPHILLHCSKLPFGVCGHIQFQVRNIDHCILVQIVVHCSLYRGNQSILKVKKSQWSSTCSLYCLSRKRMQKWRCNVGDQTIKSIKHLKIIYHSWHHRRIYFCICCCSCGSVNYIADLLSCRNSCSWCNQSGNCNELSPVPQRLICNGLLPSLSALAKIDSFRRHHVDCLNRYHLMLLARAWVYDTHMHGEEVRVPRNSTTWIDFVDGNNNATKAATIYLHTIDIVKWHHDNITYVYQ